MTILELPRQRRLSRVFGCSLDVVDPSIGGAFEGAFRVAAEAIEGLLREEFGPSWPVDGRVYRHDGRLHVHEAFPGSAARRWGEKGRRCEAAGLLAIGRFINEGQRS
jgi:hypothetical protein